MAHYKITSITWDSTKEEYGHDLVLFKARIVSDAQERSFPLLLNFRKVIEHASQKSSIIIKIVENARKSVKGWDPQESAMIRELEEFGFNICQLAQKAFESFYDLEKEYMRMANTKVNPDLIEAIANELGSLVPDIKKETVKHYHLYKQLKSIISDAVLKQYPVIINSSLDNILELQTILVKHIPDLTSDLINLIEKSEEE